MCAAPPGASASRARAGTSDSDSRLERADVSTSSGDVEVKLPRTLGCALDLGSSNGDIHAEVPLSVENVTRHKLTGIVRRGTAPLVVRTASGDINVSEAAP